MDCEFRSILGWLKIQIPSLEFEIINSIRFHLWLDLIKGIRNQIPTYCWSDFIKSFCLDIRKKMKVLGKFYLLVKTLNMNDNNEENFYGVSAYFIRKLTSFFFIIIGENIPLSKIYRFLKVQHWHVYMNPCTYSWINIFHILINNNKCLRHTLTGTLDVFMDILIFLHIMIWLLGYINILGKCYILNFHKMENNSLSQDNHYR